MVKNSSKLRTIREIISIYNSKTNDKLKKWLNGSAEYGYTTNRNKDIFRSIGIIPRVLKNFSTSNSSCSFFGSEISSPFLIAPMGGISQFNSKAEFIISEAAEKAKIPYFFPNNSCYSLTEINCGHKKNYLYRALYLDSDLDYCKKNILEAEEFNCKAIAITVDSPVRPVSYNKIDTGYDSRRHYKKFGLKEPVKNQNKSDPINWKVIEYVRKITKKPIILKGILSWKDAKVAANLGVNGIWISNHGGRNLETDITSIEVIEEIRAAVSKKVKLIVDGGIRTGTDIFKTLSLGADFVAIGRPVVYGLAAGNRQGVDKMIELFAHELLSTMRICGVKVLDEINKSFIVNRLNRLR
jgi:isopentenyl diphosphate isomerase/L-lactate dehydrogenase-like FMN-dependent dehydrogenase